MYKIYATSELKKDNDKEDDKKDESKKHNAFNIIPSHPRRALFCGPTGSGKSALVINLLCRENFLKGYYDRIFFFSPNVIYEQDNELIKIANPKTRVEFFETPDEFPSVIEEIKSQKKKKKSLIIIDDFISNQKFMKSKSVTDCFIMMRKYNCATWVLSQYYKKSPPLHRVNSEHLIIFSQPDSELKKIAEENSTPSFGKKFFEDAFKMVHETPYSFLHINKTLRPHDRFHFNFDHKITKL